jgi:hypothetical protein
MSLFNPKTKMSFAYAMTALGTEEVGGERSTSLVQAAARVIANTDMTEKWTDV